MTENVAAQLRDGVCLFSACLADNARKLDVPFVDFDNS